MNIGVRHSRAEHPAHGSGTSWTAEPSSAGVDWALELARADRACCCSAQPAVAVVLPDLGSDPVALLLCGHHYRACRDGLNSRGAQAYDRDGRLVTDDLWPVA